MRYDSREGSLYELDNLRGRWRAPSFHCASACVARSMSADPIVSTPSHTVITQNTQSAWRPIGRRRSAGPPTTLHRWELSPTWSVCIREKENISKWMKERSFVSPKRSTTQPSRTIHASGLR